MISPDHLSPSVAIQFPLSTDNSNTMAIHELPELLSHEEMKKNQIPIPFRDRCASLLIPLNKCRKQGGYLPWTCVEERHDYEHCQYLDFKRRIKELEDYKKERDASA